MPVSVALLAPKRLLHLEAAFYELTNKGRCMSVARASRLLSNALYENGRLCLSIGTMIMGFVDDGNAEEVGSPSDLLCGQQWYAHRGRSVCCGIGRTFALKAI